MWRVGDVIDGRYEVSRVHEHGGMGLVYRVRHLAWGIDLAVKSPRPELFRSAEDQRRFVAEAETWVSLGLHPHVCNCYYVRVLGGVPRVFAEYVPGGSLQEWISDRRLYDGEPPQVLARIVDIAIQTAWGLDHAHDQGLVHRDVKPANVLLDAGDSGDGGTGSVTAKITDFGLARARDVAVTLGLDAPPGASILVPGGDGMTPLYASPEQAAGDPVGRRTDIYSFAVSVLEMCAGGASWMAGSIAGAALAGYRTGEVVGAAPMTAALGNLLARCLRHDPAARPKSLADVADVLGDIYESVTGEAYTRSEPVAADLLSDEFNNRAVSLLDLDRHADADQAFGQALKIDPQHARAGYNAGLTRWRRGAVADDALLDEIEATRADTGDSWEVRYVLAQIHLERGDLTAARELLGELADERPDDPETAEAQRKIRSGEITDARCAGEWQVPWRREGYPVLLALTADGGFMVIGERDGTVHLYDVHAGQRVETLGTHPGPVRAVDVTPDGRFAVSVCESETVLFWDLTEHPASTGGRCLHASPSPPSKGTDRGADGRGTVRLTPDGQQALHVSPDGRLRVWNTHSGQARTLDDDADGLVAVSADGSRALVLGRQPARSRTIPVRMWSLASGRCERELTVPGLMMTSMCLSADGRFAATASFEEGIRVWELADGHCEHVLASESNPDALSLSADARFALSGSKYEDAVRLWELESRRCLRTFQAHQGGTTVVGLDADGRFGLSAGQDGMVRRWKLPGGYRAAPLLSRPRPHVELTELGDRLGALVTEASRVMATGRFPAALDLARQARAIEGYERAPRVMSTWWDLGRHAVRKGLRAAWSSRLLTGATSVHAADLTGDGRIAVSGGADGTVRLWDTESSSCLRELQGHRDSVGEVCLSADGQWVLSSSRDSTVRLWEVDTGVCRRVLTVDRSSMDRSLPVRFSANGRQAVLGGGSLPLWDLETGDLTRELEARRGLEGLVSGFGDICVGDDGRLAATATYSGLQLWDLGSGRVVDELRHGMGYKHGTVSLSADGRLALAGGHDGLQLWNIATGDVIWSFEYPREGRFHTIRMTADGRFAISGGSWSSMVVWDLRSGRSVQVLDGHEPGVGHLALTPDGRFVLAGHNGYLRLWELDWELDVQDAADWDDGAAPYVEAFLRRQGSQWTDDDFDALLRRLQDVGYGWLRADGVRAQLGRMARDSGGSTRR